jgi:hypothetical protein
LKGKELVIKSLKPELRASPILKANLLFLLNKYKYEQRNSFFSTFNSFPSKWIYAKEYLALLRKANDGQKQFFRK